MNSGTSVAWTASVKRRQTTSRLDLAAGSFGCSARLSTPPSDVPLWNTRSNRTKRAAASGLARLAPAFVPGIVAECRNLRA